MATSTTKPPTGALIFTIIGLALFSLWLWVDPGKFSLKYDDQITYHRSIAFSDRFKPLIYASDKDTVCTYLPSKYSEGSDKISPTYFTTPETYEGVTYYPIGYMSNSDDFDYAGPVRTISCNTDKQLLVKEGAMWGDLRAPALVFIGLGLVWTLAYYLYTVIRSRKHK